MRHRVDVRSLRNVLIIIGLFCGAFGAMQLFGIRFNWSSSHVPAGIWQAVRADTISVGDVVTVDIKDLFDESPDISDDRIVFFWSTGIMKYVAAFEGAVVERSGDGISIDGRDHPHAAIDPRFAKIDLPYRVSEGCVWLMNDSPDAYDSRYFGAVPKKFILDKVVPLWIW